MDASRQLSPLLAGKFGTDFGIRLETLNSPALLIGFMNSPRGSPSLRTLLVLGRVSNLPTVWSNCLAGWLISGGGVFDQFFLLCAGTSLLYVGGMFLNDAFDIEFDRQHRAERPIPSGAASLRIVLQLGFCWLALGAICLSMLGRIPGMLGVLLAFLIIIYDAIHKMFVFAPIIMAACRFVLVLIASSAALEGINGLSIWSALVLACYIVGLSYLARKESAPGPLRYWPTLLLCLPLLLAVVVNQGIYQKRAAIIGAVVVLWIFRCLRFTYWHGSPNVGRTVSGLLAGIVLVDLLSSGGLDPTANLAFAVLFLTALLFQRMVPAT